MGGLFCFNFLNDKVNSEQSTPIGYNVTGLCVRWRLEPLHSKQLLKMNRTTTYQITTEPPLTPKPMLCKCVGLCGGSFSFSNFSFCAWENNSIIKS